jgi:uncharacterized membrane protein YhaH (DUF805 family)
MVAKLQAATAVDGEDAEEERVIVIPELFFSSKGRIGRGEYWIGAAAILASLALGSAAPQQGLLMLVAGLVSLVMFYSSICLYSKRLHDLGLSGWLQVILYVAGVLFAIIAVVQIMPAAIRLAMEHRNDPAGLQAAMKTMPRPNFLLANAYLILRVLFTVGLGLVPSRTVEDADPAEPRLEFA